MKKITVAVLTYRRPEELRLALHEILRHVQALNVESDAFAAGVLVIDNDPSAGAGDVVRSFDPMRVKYVHEPIPGISAGRNRALDASEDSDLLVFIDDDERPNESWLRPLLETWLSTGAAAVRGRVVSSFEEAVDPWIEAGGFFQRPRRPTGTLISAAASGNLLLDLTQIREFGVRFDNRMGLTGGEDTLFSKQLIRQGGKIVWCDESEAFDFVPTSRATRRWVLQRSWSHGNSASLVEQYLVGETGRILIVRLRGVVGGGGRLVAGIGRFAAGVATGSLEHRARGMRMAFYGAGMFSGALGHVYQEYGRKN